MNLFPSNIEELPKALAKANDAGEKVDAVNLSKLNRILEHFPEDMTVTVELGITLAELQAQLAKRGQWLAIDPPNPEKTSIAEIINLNLSGPRRFGYGTIRDQLIGIKVVLADGRIVRSGGKVVKNVAGYDLCKLFIGSRGTLCVPVEATFKLRPISEEEKIIKAHCANLEQAAKLIEAVMQSELTPVVFDLHNLAAGSAQRASDFSVVIGLAGTREDVAWQMDKARQIGICENASLDYEKNFWNGPDKSRWQSVLPSRLVETVRTLGNVPFVARAGNGLIWYRGGAEPAKAILPLKLMKRIKETYDPKNIFPSLEL